MSEQEPGQSLVAAGGWCTPTQTTYGLAGLGMRSLPWGFAKPGTPEYAAHQEHLRRRRAQRAAAQAYVRNQVGDTATAQEHTISQALREADRLGFELHIWDPPHDWTDYDVAWLHCTDLDARNLYRFIGIEYTEPVGYQRHTTPSTSYEWDD